MVDADFADAWVFSGKEKELPRRRVKFLVVAPKEGDEDEG